MVDTRPIGVFDSGLGGLTAVRELSRCLPHEDIVYFGDTGRVPYGTRSRETIERYSLQDARFLLSHGVKMIVMACGTASSSVSSNAMNTLPVPWTGVIEPTAKVAAQGSPSGRIGVIGTAATIRSESFVRAIHAIRPDAEITAHACTLLVPLVEAGWTAPEHPVARLMLEDYLMPLRIAQVDTLILGCTHYPLLRPLIAQIMGESVTLVDSGEQTALYTAALLEREGLAGDPAHKGIHRFYISDTVDRFTEIASAFLGSDITGQIEQVDIERY